MSGVDLAALRKFVKELALLHHQLRNATVVSQDTVQLLTIGRDDFFDIFMGQSANPGELPEHLKFLSQLEFAKDFPMEKILENPEVCLLHFFKRGEVIVQDSSQSDWIYIIKSGTCQVMKELNGAQGLKLHKRSKTMDDLTMRLPKLGTAEQAPKIYTGKKRHRSYTMPTALRRAMTEYEDSLRLTGGRLPVLEEKALVSVDPSSRDGVERPVPGRTPGYSRSKLSRFPEMKKTAHFVS
ncbi:uncharacterized protein LOC106163213 [Lingula anatina]|uniref:Uncharacterized protein LOC106163213 n=1 Tax=Lingula anatina TaxID=7574 RepID=A0A1S3IFE5_LINAN|nr:uncharacterized protein LOC106163213 [Lingula anatina]|eukprot:XP_013396184.1 uncharacterized protein LOC106163213 [Lingula anatina]